MRLLILSATLLAAALPVLAKDLTITVTAGKHDRTNVPVCVPLSLPKDLAGRTEAAVLAPDGVAHLAQLTSPSLMTESIAPAAGEARRDLHFVLPSLKAGDALTFTLSSGPVTRTATPAVFAWKDAAPGETDLLYNGHPVLRYMHAAFDDSTKEKREQTFKVYHHLFAPAGELITKGPGGLYTHHRGLFYGFKATYGAGKGVTADTWHCPPPPNKMEAHLAHEKTLASEAGPLLGRHRVQIGWHGTGKERFAVEERELTVYAVPHGRLVEFASKLTPVKGAVKVDGDPQHAGFHFRASNEVADTTKGETYYLRPDGKDKPGATRNWDPKTKQGPVNLPWDAMSFVVGGKRYTAAYLDRPANPKEARSSERDYGRLGSYFVAEATEKKPLLVDYRLWLQEGEMTGAGVAAKSADFAEPAGATVK